MSSTSVDVSYKSLSFVAALPRLGFEGISTKIGGSKLRNVMVFDIQVVIASRCALEAGLK